MLTQTLSVAHMTCALWQQSMSESREPVKVFRSDNKERKGKKYFPRVKFHETETF